MLYHASCGTRWCFVCRRVGTCSDFDCRATDAMSRAPSTPPSSTPSLTPRQTPRGSPSPPTYAERAAKKGPPLRGTVLMVFSMLVMLVGVATCMGLGFQQLRGLPRSGFLGAPDTCSTPTCVSTQVPVIKVIPHLDA